MVTTSGGAMALPLTDDPRATPFPSLLLVPSLAGAILLFVLLVFRPKTEATQHPRRIAFGGAFAAVILFTTLTTTGCGGGSYATTAPPPVITPQGTSTITVTPTAVSTSGKPLQLQAIQLTLTVN
jgi:hypothetical protein